MIYVYLSICLSVCLASYLSIDRSIHPSIHIYMFQARAQALASLRSHAPVFAGISNQDSFSAMSASRTIQAASIFCLDNLLATASALYTSSCLLFWLHFSTSAFSPITIFWICRIQVLPQGCGGSLAQSLLHLILRVCWNQYRFNHLLLGLIVSGFGWVILLLAIPDNCLLHRHFLHEHFSWFFTFHSKIKEVFHIKSYFSLSSFAGMHTHRHSVQKRPWQSPFPVLSGLKVPVYKVKFVIRTFCLEVTTARKLLSSAPTTPCHITGGEFLLSSLRFNFRGQDKIFLLATSTPLPCS